MTQLTTCTACRVINRPTQFNSRESSQKRNRKPGKNTARQPDSVNWSLDQKRIGSQGPAEAERSEEIQRLLRERGVADTLTGQEIVVVWPTEDVSHESSAPLSDNAVWGCDNGSIAETMRVTDFLIVGYSAFII